jgi:hypothetical protein
MLQILTPPRLKQPCFRGIVYPFYHIPLLVELPREMRLHMPVAKAIFVLQSICYEPYTQPDCHLSQRCYEYNWS